MHGLRKNTVRVPRSVHRTVAGVIEEAAIIAPAGTISFTSFGFKSECATPVPEAASRGGAFEAQAMRAKDPTLKTFPHLRNALTFEITSQAYLEDYVLRPYRMLNTA